MKKRMQRGFTLIELMIVVAVIGILAAVAIPSYQDYTARAQVSEAVNLVSGLKSVFSEFYTDNGVWPSAVTEVSNTTNGKYVSSINIASGAGGTGTIVISATMKGAGSTSADIQNKIYALGTSDSGKTWDCGETGVAATTNTIDSQFLPATCK